MDSYEYTELLKKLTTKVDNIAQIIKPEELISRLGEIEMIEQDPEFWNDAKKAAELQKEKTSLNSLLTRYTKAKNVVVDAVDLYEMANSENDEATIEELYKDADHLEDHITNLEIAMMLSGENDNKNSHYLHSPRCWRDGESRLGEHVVPYVFKMGGTLWF